MYDAKLVQLFIRFSPEERRRLRKWIVSEFVNKNQDIVRFFRFLDTRTTDQFKTLTKEKIHAFLYPGKSFNDLRIRHLIWMTTDLLEDFVAYMTMEQQASLKEQLLAQYYMERELYKFANQSLEDGMAVSEKLPLRNDTYYINQYRLQSGYYQVNSRDNRSQDFNLQLIIDNITIFTVIETLKYACIIQSLQKISALKIENHLLSPVLDVVQKQDLLRVPTVRIYYHIYRVVTDEDEAAFDALTGDIKTHNHCFSPHDLRDLYLLAINFCIKRSNQNMENYTRKAFELYVYAVSQGFLLEHNTISRFSFTNVVTLGIKLREFEASEQFVKKYSDLIAKEYRENTIDFNTAKLLYARQQYKKALKILMTNEFKDAIWNLNAKYILLKIFWETDDMDSFDTQLRAFKLYIRRKSNVGYHKGYFNQVIEALSTLQDIRKHPAKYKNYRFPETTPDRDWFVRSLEKP